MRVHCSRSIGYYRKIWDRTAHAEGSSQCIEGQVTVLNILNILHLFQLYDHNGSYQNLEQI